MNAAKPFQILIVDDVDKNVQLLAEILLGEGYDVSPASSGEEALDALQSEELPALILMDIMMPGMSGIEAVQKIKKDDRLKEIPVIFLSAKTETESIVEALNSGGADYIQKPFQKAELLARVEVHLNNMVLRQKLIQSNRILDEEVKARDRLLAIIGHDLKSPLGSLMGLASLYAKPSSGIETSELNVFANLVNKSLGNVLNLLSDLLTWARLQGDHLKIIPVMINVHEIVEHVAEFIHESASLKKIQISIEGDHLLKCYSDRFMLETVLRNLLSNAVKFTHENKKILIKYFLSGHLAEIHVIDEGVGISEKILKGLFDLETRHHSRGTNKETGTGFGLKLCREMIEKNNGTIGVDSVENSGSNFFIRLPAEKQSS